MNWFGDSPMERPRPAYMNVLATGDSETGVAIWENAPLRLKIDRSYSRDSNNSIL